MTPRKIGLTMLVALLVGSYGLGAWAGYTAGKHGCDRRVQLAQIEALREANAAICGVTAVASDAASVAQWLNLWLAGEPVQPRSRFTLWAVR